MEIEIDLLILSWYIILDSSWTFILEKFWTKFKVLSLKYISYYIF